MDGFTFTGIAFPVAPVSLSGFTVQGFAWVDVEAATAAPERVNLVATYSPSVELVATDPSRVSLTARSPT